MAPAAASVWVPMDRIAVTTAGRPVGIADTENAMAVSSSVWNGTLRSMPMPMDASRASPAMTRIWLVSFSSWMVSGVFSFVWTWSMLLIWPTSVAMPVADGDHRAGTPGDLRVHERHVHAVAERGVSGDYLDLLGHRRALAGERRLVDLERRRAHDAAVRRDEVTGLDIDDVPGDDLLHGDLGQLAASPDLGLDDHHLLERGNAGGGLALLVQAHRRVQQGQQDEHDARGHLPRQEQAGDTRDEQHQLHRVLVLTDERLPAGLALALREAVGAVRRRSGQPTS